MVWYALKQAFEESEDPAGGYADLGADEDFGGHDDMMGGADLQTQQQQQQPQQQSAPSDEDADEDDAALRAFQRKWEAELSEKDAKMEAERKEMLERAKQELEQFKVDKQKALEEKQKANRAQESEFLEDINEALTAENPWERILTLVDINQSSKEAGDRDLARLRKIFVQLKNDPPASS